MHALVSVSAGSANWPDGPVTRDQESASQTAPTEQRVLTHRAPKSEPALTQARQTSAERIRGEGRPIWMVFPIGGAVFGAMVLCFLAGADV
ncbi:hypothetical protein FOMPIDRAFT_1056848 [Fomitopsis schrenkii]|uniref:Uncharacterized protein n=1 Tax=Fomitopsis schrenkii TaxID=2126942 RepID=S8ERN0_FOMSC|nr:hypothetical protein FOMPIDRAFT_1056848 [Fomitopsis schrenkii]